MRAAATLRALRPSLPVVVVGAGPAGIAVAAALTERQTDVIVLDAHEGVGGMWDTNNPGSPCRSDVTLVNRAAAMGYHDAPFDSRRDYPLQREVLDYLRAFAIDRLAYAELRLGSGVESCWRDEDAELWNVALGTGEVIRAQAVVVCTGSFWHPHIPREAYAAQSSRSVHSKDFHPDEIEAGDRIRIVGAGNSAADVAISAYEAGAEVWLDWRSTPWFLPRRVEGQQATEARLVIDGVAKRSLGREAQRRLARRAIGSRDRFEAVSGGCRPTAPPYQGPTITGDDLLKLLEERERVWLCSQAKQPSTYDLTVFATGYARAATCLGLRACDLRLDASGLVSMAHKGLYVTGNIISQQGGFWIFSRMADVIAALIETEIRDVSWHSDWMAGWRDAKPDLLWGMRVNDASVGPKLVYSEAYIETLAHMTADINRSDASAATTALAGSLALG